MLQALDIIVGKLKATTIGANSAWNLILRNFAEYKFKAIDSKYLIYIEDAISEYVTSLPSKRKREIWNQTEAGIRQPDEMGNILIESIEMDLEVELLEEVTKFAATEAKKL